MKSLYTPLFTAVVFLTCIDLTAQVLPQDSLALVDLYKSTGGPLWTNNSGWLSGQPVGKWFGVVLSGNRVFSMDLRTNNLTGTLPSSFGDLTEIRSIVLDVNEIGGSIPVSIGNLVNLQYLSIIVNKLTGAVPASIGNLSSLIWLRLSDNMLSGQLPSSLGNLSQLQYFYLGDNRFTGTIPASLGNLSNLLDLQLYINQLSGSIPAAIGNLTKLQILSFDLNQLTGSIPAAIGLLPNLANFTAQSNHLSGTVPPFPVTPAGGYLNLYLQDNEFNFSGMEAIGQKIVWQKFYSPQARLKVKGNCAKMWVSAGGTAAHNTYRWYSVDGTLLSAKTGDSTFIPPGAGNYYATVTNSMATDLTLSSDTAGTVPVFQNLAATICAGTVYTLPSGKQESQSGIYKDTSFTVTGCGGTVIFTLNLTVTSPMIQNTISTICAGSSYPLPSGYIATQPGIYHDTIKNSDGCVSMIVNLTLDVVISSHRNISAVICSGGQYPLPSGRMAYAEGLYQDTLRSIRGGCDSIITSLNLSVDMSVRQFSDSVAICPDAAAATLLAGDNTAAYLWNTGDHLNSIAVNDDGLFTVAAQGSNGCSTIDSFTVFHRSSPVVALNKINTICKDQPRLIDAGKGYKYYLWNTGSSNQSIFVIATGIYWVYVTDRFGCSGADTVALSEIVQVPTQFLPPDTSLCLYSGINIAAQEQFAEYLWNTGEKSPAIHITQPGVYRLGVTDGNGCQGTDSIVLHPRDCAETIIVPNAFTPNGDGKNDMLRPVNVNHLTLNRYRFGVYNRYGQPVFTTTRPDEGWNGQIAGLPQNTGAFVWQLEYQLPDNTWTKRSGTVLLLR